MSGIILCWPRQRARSLLRWARKNTVLWVGDCVKNSGLSVRMLERLWQDLHANVTRNHRHTDFVELCHEVASYLDAVSPWLPGRCPVWAETR